jgi:hypothetical protein
MSQAWWMDAGLAALWTATILQTVFVALYATRPWRRHFVGRALFIKSVSLMLILQVSLCNQYLTYRYQLQVSVVLTWFVAVAIAYQTGALIAQMRADRQP